MPKNTLGVAVESAHVIKSQFRQVAIVQRTTKLERVCSLPFANPFGTAVEQIGDPLGNVTPLLEAECFWYACALLRCSLTVVNRQWSVFSDLQNRATGQTATNCDKTFCAGRFSGMFVRVCGSPTKC